MRCDVCDTKIPPGVDRCPNCGYRVRQRSVATHSQTISTEYPEPEVFKPKKNRRFYRQRNTSQKAHKSKLKTYILAIMVLIFVGQVAFELITNIVTDYNSHNYTEFTGESLQEGIDNGDDDGTLQLALDYENDLTTFFTDELLMDVDVSENYSIYEDEYSAYINVYGTNDTVSLTASMSFLEQQPYHQSVTLSWTNQGSIRENPIYLDTSLIEKINERFQIDIYQSIEQYKSQLKVDEDDDTRFVVSDYQDDTSVYFSESLGSDDNYFVYLSLGQDIGEN
ncbi:MAG: hypothetical protein ACLSVX_02870 [Massilimicrobiota timonensis]